MGCPRVFNLHAHHPLALDLVHREDMSCGVANIDGMMGIGFAAARRSGDFRLCNASHRGDTHKKADREARSFHVPTPCVK